MSDLLNKVKLAIESASAIAKNVVDGKDLIVSDDIKNQRLEMCKGCPALQDLAGHMQCGDCGCFIKVKASLSDMKCPRNKWTT